jgi:O-antigen/teichoic acid export membrane protein
VLIYGVGDVLSKGLHFLLIPVLLEYLDPEQLGILALAAGYGVVAGFFLHLNLNSAVFRFHSDCEGQSEARELAGTLILFQLAWSSMVAVLLVWVFPPMLAAVFDNDQLELPFRLAGGLAFVTSVAAIPLSVLQMRQEAGRYRLLTVAGSVLTIMGILYFVVVRGGGASGFLLGQTLGGALMMGPYGFVAWRRMTLRLRRDVLLQCLAFSLPLVPYAVSGWTMDLSNRYLVEYFMGLEDVGRYNAAYQFALIMQAMLNAFALAWIPVFYQLAKEDDAERKLAVFGKIYWCVTLLLGLVLTLGSKEALGVFADGVYRDSYAVVPALMATQALTCLWHLFVNPLFLRKKTAYLPVVMGSAAALSILLNLFMIPRWGLVGAGWAVFAANVFVNAAVGTLSLRWYPIPYRTGQMVIAGVGAVATFLVVESLYRAGWPVAVAVSAILLFPLILIATRTLTTGEIRTVSRYLFARVGNR